jgi:hypothetical protein
VASSTSSEWRRINGAHVQAYPSAAPPYSHSKRKSDVMLKSRRLTRHNKAACNGGVNSHVHLLHLVTEAYFREVLISYLIERGRNRRKAVMMR